MIGSQISAEMEAEYRRLGYDLGWRFLTCPIKNINRSFIAIIFINPGGNAFEMASVSVEHGSAYVVESWKGNPPGEETLQVQIRRMCELLSVQPVEVLSGYLVPFRSRNWNLLPNKTEALNFGRSLWKKLLLRAKLQTIIVVGKETRAFLNPLFASEPVQIFASDWGRQTIDVTFGPGGERIVAVPHLSRFRLFNRPRSEGAFQRALLASY